VDTNNGCKENSGFESLNKTKTPMHVACDMWYVYDDTFDVCLICNHC
jgi:hypothetical protein